MANPELSRLAAKTFNQYKVPLDKGFDWAIEIESAKSMNDLSSELQSFLTNPYFINPKPKLLEKHLAGRHDQASHGQRASTESPSFTENESKAISTYSGREALQINAKLRGQTKGVRPTVFDMRPEAIDDAVSNLDKAIGKSKLTQKLTLEREIPITSLKQGIFSSAIGKTISDKGFLSMKKGTAALPNRNGFIRLRVIADVGTNALDLSFINPNAMSEVIFPRNTKIKITSISGSGEYAMVRGEIVG